MTRAAREAPGDAGSAVRIANLDPACARPKADLRFREAQPAVACALQAGIDQRRRCERAIDAAAKAPRPNAGAVQRYYCALAPVSVAVALTMPGADRTWTRAASRRTCCACRASIQPSQSAKDTASNVVRT